MSMRDMQARGELVDIECQVLIEKELAIRIDDGTKKAWLPRSQIEIEPNGRTVIVTMPRWLAEEKGLV